MRNSLRVLLGTVSLFIPIAASAQPAQPAPSGSWLTNLLYVWPILLLLVGILVWSLTDLKRIGLRVRQEEAALDSAIESSSRVPPNELLADLEFVVRPATPPLNQLLRNWASSMPMTTAAPDGMCPTLVARRAMELRAFGANGLSAADQSALDGDAEDDLISMLDGPRFSAHIAVFIGLLGTLIGLIVTVVKLGAVSGAANANVDQVLAEIAKTMGAAGSAFVSAGVGVVVSVILAWRCQMIEIDSQELLRKFRRFSHVQLSAAAKAEAVPVSVDALLQQVRSVLKALKDDLPNITASLQTAGDTISSAATKVSNSLGKHSAATEKLLSASATLNDATEGTVKQLEILSNLSSQIQSFQTTWEEACRASIEHVTSATEELRSGTRNLDSSATAMTQTVREFAEDTKRNLTDTSAESQRLLEGLTRALGQLHQYGVEVSARIAAISDGAVAGRVFVSDPEKLDRLSRAIEEVRQEVVHRAESPSQPTSQPSYTRRPERLPEPEPVPVGAGLESTRRFNPTDVAQLRHTPPPFPPRYQDPPRRSSRIVDWFKNLWGR